MRLSNGQYFGRTAYSINVNGIILTKTEYRGSEQIPKHLHSNPYFCYVLKGSYLETFNAKQIECNKGDIIFHTADSEHSNQFFNCASVCFNLEMEKQWLEKISYPPFSRTIYRNNDEATGLLFNKVLYEAMMLDELSPLMIESLTIEALVRLERKAKYGTVPKYIKTVKNYINDQHYNNPSLTELAQIASVSPEHLAREFKKYVQCTIGDYTRSVKVRKACELLQSTKKDLAQIAYELGFADQSHFNRLFKKEMGITPTAFRLK